LTRCDVCGVLAQAEDTVDDLMEQLNQTKHLLRTTEEEKRSKEQEAALVRAETHTHSLLIPISRVNYVISDSILFHSVLCRVAFQGNECH